MTAYYNEIDPFAAGCLRELIKAGQIAPGEVDTRSIEDVVPTDLAGFTQCHFFAGIAVWSYALRLAGWPDNRPVWTGSCPCQPFSEAGKGKGFADKRHLWPAFFHLISQCSPSVVFGEQVASKDGLAWLDLVQTDLEGADYTCGAVDTCSAGFGAPHIRQRLYWVADTEHKGRHYGRFLESRRGSHNHGVLAAQGSNRNIGRILFDPCADSKSSMRLGVPLSCSGLADSSSIRRIQQRKAEDAAIQGECAERSKQYQKSSYARQLSGRFEGLCGAGGLANSKSTRWGICNSAHKWAPDAPFHAFANPSNSAVDGQQRFARQQPGSVNGFWRNADWLFCRDGRWRPVESGTFPLAYGAANRVGRLRCYGNAINAIQAKEFIKSYMDYCESTQGGSGGGTLPPFVSSEEGKP